LDIGLINLFSVNTINRLELYFSDYEHVALLTKRIFFSGFGQPCKLLRTAFGYKYFETSKGDKRRMEFRITKVGMVLLAECKP
jgi:hypothetical protein